MCMRAKGNILSPTIAQLVPCAYIFHRVDKKEQNNSNQPDSNQLPKDLQYSTLIELWLETSAASECTLISAIFFVLTMVE